MKISNRLPSRLMPHRTAPSSRVHRLRPTLEALENRFMLSAAPLAPGPELLAGDANQDFTFDQLDLLQVLQAGKYLSGEAATWAEGDWNGAPGGIVGNPSAGDGVFNQLDIVTALTAGAYGNGPYAAIAPGGVEGDDQTSIIYDPETGEIAVDAPAGTELTSINIDSAAGIFTGLPDPFPSWENDADNNIFKATFGSSFGSLSFGNVAQAGLSEDFVANDLTVVGSLAGGGDLGPVDLIYKCDAWGQDLSGSSFAGQDLNGACFAGATLVGADFRGAMLTGASFSQAALGGADFTGAFVREADFAGTTSKGFTAEQVYRTVSYQEGDLTGLILGGNDLTNWNLAGKNLTGVDLSSADLTNANLAGANLTNAYLSSATLTDADLSDATIDHANLSGIKGFAAPQLYSTATYEQGDLSKIILEGNDLSGWVFAGKNLSGARFGSYSSRNATNLSGADFRGANLEAVELRYANLSNANLAGADLTSANLSSATLTDADLSGAHSVSANMSSANLSGAQLTKANLVGSTLVNASLAGANLSHVNLTDAELRNANLSDSMIDGAILAGAVRHGLTSEQLYSTASYKNGNLVGIDLSGNNLRRWDFTGQDLSHASFHEARLSGTDFQGADLRGVSLLGANVNGALFTGADLRGTIWPTGYVLGLELSDDFYTFVLRDGDSPITIHDRFVLQGNSQLTVVLGDATWGSTIQIASGIVPTLAGTLSISLSQSVDVTQMVGQTLDLFDWNTELESGNVFDHVELPPGTVWDLTHLYDTGEVVLTGVTPPPEPGDADQDLDFDQLDVVLVLQVAKYLTGEPATWGEGDWNGDGVSNQLDIVAALQTGNFMQGPYAGSAADSVFAAFGS